ncbi:MAG: FliM/FliN family flagellar motor switch protein [Oscillospiraceae bacterium]
MAASPGAGAAVVTPTRALRLALTRAGEGAAGLALTPLGVADEELDLADLLARVGDDWLFLRLDAAGGPGIAALDPALRLAVVEMQTRGSLSEAEPEHRPPTAADAALAEPVVAAFLAELAALAAGTALDGWPGDCVIGARLADRRALGLVLPETGFRAVSLSCWLGIGERQGAFLMALPATGPPDPRAERAQRAARWGQALAGSVLGAGLVLDAVLHRLRLPLAQAEGLAPGQLLALPGVRVAGVQLQAAGGRPVTSGRLGQSGGMRAIRIEPAPAPELAPGLAAALAPDGDPATGFGADAGQEEAPAPLPLPEVPDWPGPE